MKFYTILALLFGMMICALYLRKSEQPTIQQYSDFGRSFRSDLRSEALTLDNVYTYLCLLDVAFPDIVTRQCILETGWLTSHNCKERNNLFGMKGGKVTEDNPNGYAIYPNWKQSCRAYLRWQRHRYSGENDYYQFLVDIGYAQSPEYIEKLKSLNVVFFK